jgi:hypothetical protein
VASTNPELTEVATSGSWHIYEVSDTALVVPLANEPAVLDDIATPRDWIDVNAAWYQDPSRWDVFYAADGPDEWQRIDSDQTPEARPVAETVDVTNVDEGRTNLSFDVSEVGTPILVRISYFPNWKVDGAEGPYRVSPNLMVVIPTDTHVELHYGREPVDLIAILFTLLGIAGVVWLTRQPPIDMEPRRRRRLDTDGTEEIEEDLDARPDEIHREGGEGSASDEPPASARR